MKSKIILGIAVITFFILSGCTEKGTNVDTYKIEGCEVVNASKGVYLVCDGRKLSVQEASMYYEVYKKEDGLWYIEIPQPDKEKGTILQEYRYTE